MKFRALAFTSCSALLLAGCSDELVSPAGPAGPSPAMAPISTLEVIDFESELHRKQLFTVYTNLGTGPIGVRGKSPFVGAPNAAVVYDSANPETWDLDLGTPSAACGGPGNGTQTGSGTPYENCRDLGKVLIVNDAVFDGDNDGLVNKADDFNQTAYDNVWLFFSFDQIGPQTVQSITALDIDGNAPNPRVELYSADTTLVATYSIPSDMPDNGSTIVDLGGTPNVSFVKVYLNGSGAIDELILGESVPAPAQLGDLVWCDENENGVQDGTEPGLSGVTVDLTCTATDGSVTNLSTVTDSNGAYLFTDLPAGTCTVTVDASTAPDSCNNVGNCPVTMDVDLAPGDVFLDADFCFTPDPVVPADDCCENGKRPAGLIFEYNGFDCSASNYAQDPGGVTCSGDPGFAGTVHIVVTDKDQLGHHKQSVFFEGDVALGGTFEMNYAGSGKSKIPGSSRIHITDLNGNVLQFLKFHTSCSEPLLAGDQFGGVMLVGCVEDGGGNDKTPKGGKGKGKK